MDVGVMESLYDWFMNTPEWDKYHVPTLEEMIWKYPEVREDYYKAKHQYRKNEREGRKQENDKGK